MILNIGYCDRSDTLHLRKSFHESILDLGSLEERATNLASSSFLKNSYVSFDFVDSYMMKELMDKQLAFLLVSRGNLFAVQVSHFGYSQYGRLSAQVGYARSFADRVAFSLSFYYYLNYATNYPSVHSVTFDVSAYVRCSRHFGVGVRVLNPAHLKYGMSREEAAPFMDMIFNVDMNYLVGKNLLIFLRAEKVLEGAFSAGAGLSCQFARHWRISMSCLLPSPKVELNFRMLLRHFELQAGMAYRYKIGFSPQLSFAFPFKISSK